MLTNVFGCLDSRGQSLDLQSKWVDRSDTDKLCSESESMDRWGDEQGHPVENMKQCNNDSSTKGTSRFQSRARWINWPLVKDGLRANECWEQPEQSGSRPQVMPNQTHIYKHMIIITHKLTVKCFGHLYWFNQKYLKLASTSMKNILHCYSFKMGCIIESVSACSSIKC